MVLFKPGTKLYAYEIAREEGNKVLYVNYLGANFVPSLADSEDVMSRTIELLIEDSGISRIVFVQQRNYSYNSQQTFMLQEISQLYVYLTKQEKILTKNKLSIINSEYLGKRYNDVGYLLVKLKNDPIGCYVDLKKLFDNENSILEKLSRDISETMRLDQMNYVKTLEKFFQLLKNTELITKSQKYLDNYNYSRDIYSNFFRPEIIPNFTFTRLVASLPTDASIVAQYEIGDEFDRSIVTILKRVKDAKYIYHLMPPEYLLEEGRQELINLARNVLIEHQPKAEEFTDPEKTRQVFFNVSRDLLRELGESKKINLEYKELNKMARILVRHTIGFGLIEVLLNDKNIQDVVLNAPIPSNPVFLRHQEYDECMTNIFPSVEDADSWAAKFRMSSGRPLDEANPILDTDLILDKIRSRISIIQQPLSPSGLAYAIRRHRESPWTLPLFIKNKMINSFAAGLLSFLIDGSRTLLVAGTRSSGKCVSGESRLVLADGAIKTAEELYYEISGKGNIILKKEECTVFYPRKKIEIFSFNKTTGKIEKKNIQYAWKLIGGETLKVKLRNGFSIETTPEHKYIVYREGFEEVQAKDLALGDKIVCSRMHGPLFAEDCNYNKEELPDNILIIRQIRSGKQLLSIYEKISSEQLAFVEIKSIEQSYKDVVYDFTIPETHNFIAEGMVIHNTSLLGALMLEIMPKYRIITVEDTRELPIDALRKLNYDILSMKVRGSLLKESAEVGADEGIRTSLRLGDSSLIVGEVRSSIRGNEEVVIIDNGIMKRVRIEELESKDLKNVYVPTIGFNLKTKLSKLTGFVKHTKRKKLLKIKTRTGREVSVTHDHSLFAPTKDFELGPVECKYLKVGNQVVIPSYMPCGFNNFNFINVFEYLPEFRVQNFESDVWKAIEVLGWKKSTEICDIASGDIYNYFRTNQKTNIPFSSFDNLMNISRVNYDTINLEVKKGSSLPLPAMIPVNEDFCRFLGYYVSEGYFSLKENNGGHIVITNSNKEIGEDLFNISEKLFKLGPSKRHITGLGKSIQYRWNCFPLASLIYKLGCGRTSHEKRVPPFIFGLSKEKIAAFLRGLYSGDNFTSSKSSGNSVRFFSISKKLVEDVSYLLLNFGIVGRIIKRHQQGIGTKDVWIYEFKNRNMIKTFFNEIGFNRKVSDRIFRRHEHTTSNYVIFDKEILKKHLIKYPRKYRHLFRFLRCSKNYLRKVVSDPKCEVSNKLRTFALGDFFLDEIKEIEEIELDEEEYVYDLSVEPTENFIGGFGGILLHNTEAKALYEAMRVGALANVVAGTIHGASPYGVFDRVVNDLGVPATSFKATDCIIVANPIKTPDGLTTRKRVVQLSEVRKHWLKDPEEEGGFVDLLKYNVEKDELGPSNELINGDSEIIKSIAGGVKGWAGNWDAVYDNILLRAKIKQELVDLSNKLKMPFILEAEFTTLSNTMFHQFSKEIQEEIGIPESKRVFPLWKNWVEKELGRKVD